VGLLVERPDDPREFAVEKLRSLTPEVKSELVRRIHMVQTKPPAASLPLPNTLRAVEPLLTIGVQDTLKLQLNSIDHRATAFGALAELRTEAMQTGNCVSFQVFFDEPSLEILVLQAWKTQEGLDAFVKSVAFTKFQPKWAGILQAAPQSKQYHQRVL